MFGSEIQQLIFALSRLPGLGPRSGRRLALYLLKKKETTLTSLMSALNKAHAVVQSCKECGNLDTQIVCSVCASPTRDEKTLCVVEEVSDLWALERSKEYKGHYFVLGGKLSAMSGVKPEDLKIPELVEKVKTKNIQEVILALNPTVEGQTTLFYIRECLSGIPTKITTLAHGVPLGGELDYLDDATLTTAMMRRLSL